jgi:hypothetical protein
MTKNERLQQIWHRYETEHGHIPAGTREAVDRAIEEGLLEEPQIDPRDILANQMAAALREEMDTMNLGGAIALTMPFGFRETGCNTRFGPRWDLLRMITWKKHLHSGVSRSSETTSS